MSLRPIAGYSRTLHGNEQTAVYLGMPGKDTKSPRILTSLTSGGHIDRRQKRSVATMRRCSRPPDETVSWQANASLNRYERPVVHGWPQETITGSSEPFCSYKYEWTWASWTLPM